VSATTPPSMLSWMSRRCPASRRRGCLAPGLWKATPRTTSAQAGRAARRLYTPLTRVASLPGISNERT
jgi:hypothetical protein